MRTNILIVCIEKIESIREFTFYLLNNELMLLSARAPSFELATLIFSFILIFLLLVITWDVQ